MPLCYIHTNLPANEIPEGVEERFANVVAASLNKPINRVAVTIVPGVRIFQLGSGDRACQVKISSIGVFDAERNPKYGPPMVEFLMKELSIIKERVTILFEDITVTQIGHELKN